MTLSLGLALWGCSLSADLEPERLVVGVDASFPAAVGAGAELDSSATEDEAALVREQVAQDAGGPGGACEINRDCSPGELCIDRRCGLRAREASENVSNCDLRRCEPGACPTDCDDRSFGSGQSDVDCGGACPSRPVGATCRGDDECEGGACDEGRCAAPDCAGCEAPEECASGACALAGCSDGVRNGGEPDVDCGASCPACLAGQRCAGPSDCESGVCAERDCAPGVGGACCQPPTCEDGVPNGTEPVADCGDVKCGLCPLGHECTEDGQCESSSCVAGACSPGVACDNGLLDGDESDVDCGGALCPGCVDGQVCGAAVDCVSGACVGGRCACGDGRQNGDEVGVDCGGSCESCSPGQACGEDADCASGACVDRVCCGGSGSDCLRCAERLSGGRTCAGAFDDAGRRACAEFLACLAQNPTACPTRSTPGCADDPGGACNLDAFGGVNGAGVTQADAILFAAGCSL